MNLARKNRGLAAPALVGGCPDKNLGSMWSRAALARAKPFVALPHERGARAHMITLGAAARTQGQIADLRQYTR
jgi:hypothetical protein